MTQRSILTSIWTSVLAVLMAVLSGFGLAVKSAPAAAAPAAAGTEGAEATAVRRPAVAARRSWRAMMRGGSLPPTIKQRIRAEAHGKTLRTTFHHRRGHGRRDRIRDRFPHVDLARSTRRTARRGTRARSRSAGSRHRCRPGRTRARRVVP